MHEIAIASKIIEEAKRQGAKNSIRVEVGELAEITPEEVDQALKSLISWNITTLFKKSEIKCENCRYQGPAKITDRGHGYCIFTCPQCNQKPEVLNGGEIKIVGVD